MTPVGESPSTTPPELFTTQKMVARVTLMSVAGAILACFLCTNVHSQELMEILVNNHAAKNGSTVSFTAQTDETIVIECYFDIIFRKNRYLYEILSTGRRISLEVTPGRTLDYLEYSVPNSKRQDAHTYRCATNDTFTEVVLRYSDSRNPLPFTGLNPLIYTISAVVLLGTLAIVAIVTCWIRARRSFNNRIFRPNTTAQDYFDYINDNEFTPLTSSEFAASLQERPPTYIESERIEQDSGSAQENGGNNRISPIPPPPQPHTLPSLSRLRVVQLENISALSDGPRSTPVVTANTQSSEPITANLIDIADNSNQTDNDTDDDPLYA